MAEWLKVDAAAGRNLKLKKAGRLGRELYRGLLEVLKEHGQGDTIPATQAHPDQLALSLPAYEFVGDEAQRGLEICADCGLVELLTDGGVRISGYDETWMPSCSSCRRPNSDQRYKTCKSCREKRLPKKTESTSADVRGSTRKSAGTRRRKGKEQDRSTPQPPSGGSGKAQALGDPDTGALPGPTPFCVRVYDMLSKAFDEPVMSNPIMRRKRARAFLDEEDGSVEAMEELIELAGAGDNPPGLLAHWLKLPGRWKDVLAEQRERRKTEDLRRKEA